MEPDAYLQNLADSENYVVIEPRGGYWLTLLEDGGLAMAFLGSRLAIRLEGPDAIAGLEAAIEGARAGRVEIDADEAEKLLDDPGLWPQQP